MSTETGALLGVLTAERRWFRYFNQGVTWKPDRRPAVEIATMSDTWRYNCTRFLERGAVRYARAYTRGCDAELTWAQCIGTSEAALDSIEAALTDGRATDDPVAWIQTTPLYRALARGLPVKGAARRHLQERAGHWEGCARNRDRKGKCTCEGIKRAHEERKTT